MKTTRNTRDNQLTPPAHASNQQSSGKPPVHPSASSYLIRKAQLTQVTVSQLGAGPSNSRPVTIGNPNIKENNTGPPLSALLKRNFTREELQEKINKYTAKLEACADNKTDRATKGKQKACFDDSLKPCQKKVSRHHQRILEQMLTITARSNAKGFVYGMITETTKPMTGASDSLRAWWKDKVVFDKAGPTQTDLYYKENSLSTNVAQNRNAKSTTELLMALSDPTLGSIMSLLMQHCDPPERKFPFEKGLRPPWWPNAQEGWWDQTGISTNEGAPPFRKPHDLKKRWKAAVILGILKLMSPNFSRPYSIVEQSRYLQSRMNPKESQFWNLAVVSEAKQYCREHLDMPVDEAAPFLHAYGDSSSSQMAPKVDTQNVSMSRKEGIQTCSPFGVVQWPLLEPPSNNPSPWSSTVPLRGQPQQGVQVSRTALEPKTAMSGIIASRYPPWAISYNPILSRNAPMGIQQNHTIGGTVETSSGMQDHHDNATPYLPFVVLEHSGGTQSTSGTQDIQNKMHGYGANISGIWF